MYPPLRPSNLLKPTWIRERESKQKTSFNKRLPTGRRFTDYKPCPVERGISLDVWVTEKVTIVSVKELSLSYNSSLSLLLGRYNTISVEAL
jgi:hypothetical protein